MVVLGGGGGSCGRGIPAGFGFVRQCGADVRPGKKQLFFFFITLKPWVEWCKSLWASNTSPPRNRFTFLRRSCEGELRDKVSTSRFRVSEIQLMHSGLGSDFIVWGLELESPGLSLYLLKSTYHKIQKKKSWHLLKSKYRLMISIYVVKNLNLQAWANIRW